MSESLSTLNRQSSEVLDFRGLFLHAWDLADDEPARLMDWMVQAGLNTLCLAGTYHNGWFIHPHHSRHRAYMTEGDVCYFHPHESLYHKTKLRPKTAQISLKKDWFEEVAERLDHGLRLVSWTIGAHNLRLGQAHPEATVINVYGDSLPHALCPANLAVREYLKALCRDLATNYPLWGVQLEAFGWMGFVHGHHHERDLVGLTALEQELMGLCVCPSCTSQAGAAGVDMREINHLIKGILDAAFQEAPQRPKKHPRTLAEVEAGSAEFKKFIAWRKQVVDSLITEIKRESLKGTSCRLLLQTEFDPALAGVVDGFGCAAYQQSPSETLRICHQACKAVSPHWNGLLQCFIQLGLGVPQSKEQLHDIIAAVKDGGCNGINFYNRSESPPKMLGWLAEIMPTFQ